MKKLSNTQVAARLEHLPDWGGDDSVIQKEFRFSDFIEAMEFVNLVGEKAEDLGHHPDICISYNSVVCMVTTHDKEGVTEADFKLAGMIEAANERVAGE